MSFFTYSSFMQALSTTQVATLPVPSLSTTLAAWREQRRMARKDREVWAMAEQDPRVMNDLICAMRRTD